jgi:NAD(P)-dependent dehydrogenase (short-subunit alcohol dehydrogenase family)
MDSFAGKLAVVTGGGSGIGRELVRQLAAQGCAVATCDWHADTVAQTAAMASGAPVTSHVCDVSDESRVLRFRDELLAAHGAEHVDLVFANAGIGGGGSFVNDSREEWERTFTVDWWGVYYCARAFLPLLIASGDGVLVNTSSVNGFWAALGGGMPNTAYSAAKFAIKGFTEALIEDLRTNAPQVRVALVMPGAVHTNIVANTLRAHGRTDVDLAELEAATAAAETEFDAATLDAETLDFARAGLVKAGLVAADASDDEVRAVVTRAAADSRGKTLSAAQAATIILDGVRAGSWRILVGYYAELIDERVRANPEHAYDYEELFHEEIERFKAPSG